MTDDDLNQVLAPAWEAIRDDHPELPAVTFTLADCACFAQVRGSAIEVNRSCLQMGAYFVMQVLLHEAVHLLDEDTGHGEGFMRIARQFRLPDGFTVRSPWCIARYGGVIRQLNARLAKWAEWISAE